MFVDMRDSTKLAEQRLPTASPPRPTGSMARTSSSPAPSATTRPRQSTLRAGGRRSRTSGSCRSRSEPCKVGKGVPAPCPPFIAQAQAAGRDHFDSPALMAASTDSAVQQVMGSFRLPVHRNRPAAARGGAGYCQPFDRKSHTQDWPKRPQSGHSPSRGSRWPCERSAARLLG
jgi:hypothetical protein